MTRPIVVFSDLDGTLLDHDDYSWAEATAAVEELRERAIPLVLVSSKTKREMLAIRRDLDNRHPFVVENGAAIHLPEGLFESEAVAARAVAGEGGLRQVLLGRARSEILESLRRIRRRRGFRFEGFADWTVEQVAWRTGLDAESAAAAMAREATEPIVWSDRDQPVEELATELEAEGLRLVRGGRFHHVMGDTDKGTAMRWLAERYREKSGELLTVALGDSPNDLEMLTCADVAIVVPRTEGPPIEPGEGPRVLRADRPGAAGWQQGMDQLFEILAASV